MSNTECLICAAELNDVWVCQLHAGDLRKMLERLPALYTELQTTAQRLDAMGRGVGSSGKGGPAPAIVNFDASELSTTFRDRIARWVIVWNREIDAQITGDKVRNQCDALAALVPRMIAHQGAGIMFDELHWLVKECLKTIDKPANREGQAYAGPCGAEFPNGTCQAQLWVRNGTHNMTCDRCGTIWDTDARRDNALVAAQNLLATAPVISRALTAQNLPVTANLIYVWQARGRLKEQGRNKADQALFRVGDVMGIIDAAPNRKRSTK